MKSVKAHTKGPGAEYTAKNIDNNKLIAIAVRIEGNMRDMRALKDLSDLHWQWTSGAFPREPSVITFCVVISDEVHASVVSCNKRQHAGWRPCEFADMC